MPDTPTSPEFDKLFATAIHRLLHDEPLQAFCDWFSQEMGASMQSELAVPAGQKAQSLRYQRSVARALWSAVPVPSHRWRPRPLPKMERNSPCHCGSGRKFKQCCDQFASLALPVDEAGLYALALAQAEPAMLTAAKLREVPPEALGIAAESWNQDQQPERTAAVLEPLFESGARMDGRHELAFDMLMDALQVMGQETRRQALAQRVAQATDRALATAARCRLVSMLADAGDETAAWELFREAQRKAPDSPQLWHLELTLLITQNRMQEARLRGPVLAAKARKADLPELAQMLAQLGKEGLAAAFSADPGEEDDAGDAVDRDWTALCEQVPPSINASECRSLYTLKRSPPHASAAPGDSLHLKPKRTLADLQSHWRRRFPIGEPMLTSLDADADALLDDLAGAAQFLQKYPLAWLSIEVLNDLLLAAAQMCNPDSPAATVRAGRRLAGHALEVLRSLAGEQPCRLDWADMGSRPALRLLAQTIELARLVQDMEQVEALTRWGLELNPNDNHGWRQVLAPVYLAQSRWQEALDLLDRYPDDMPPAQHHRALALFALGHKEQAEAVLRATHREYPRFLEALLPPVLDAPAPEEGPGLSLGGLEAAWYHRVEMRPAWVRTGALAWVQGLALKAPPAPKKTAPARPAKAPRSGAGPKGRKSTGLRPKETARLRKSFHPFAQLHGLLSAVAWSPELLMPNRWIAALEGLRAGPAEDLTQMNADLDALMRLYNHLNDQVLQTPADQPAPLQEVIALAAVDDDLCAWAAGFVQGCELAAAGWRRAGRPVGSGTGAFGELYRLAARAPAAPDQWRARQDSGQPLLAGLQDQAPLPIETLVLALVDLWSVIAPLRQARA